MSRSKEHFEERCMDSLSGRFSIITRFALLLVVVAGVLSGQPVVQFEGHADTRSVYDLSLSKDGSLIATVGSQGDVKLWPTKVD